MPVRICVAFVWVMVAMLLVLSGCQQAAGPNDAAQPELMSSTATDVISDDVASAAGIKHLLIATVEMQFLAFTEDPNAVAEVSALLTATELSTLANRRIVRVGDSGLAAVIATIVGPNVSNPATTEGGLLVTTYTEVTWGRVKCCFKDPKCCPKKKEQ